MRARDRRRVERHAQRALAAVGLPVRLSVAWTLHPLNGASGHVLADCFTFGSIAVVVLDEPAFALGSPEEREDTVRHELAHLIAWHRHGHDIADHGHEWRAARRALDSALEEDE